MRIIIYPYKSYSDSAKLIINKLQEKTNSWVRKISGIGKFKPKPTDIIINWGNSTIPNFGTLGILNDPNAVAIAINKLDSFRMFEIHGVKTPEWTTEYEKALEWSQNGEVVVCRRILTGKGGNGITLAFSSSELCPAPLYVKYKKKKKEYRVHVFKDKVIRILEKRKRTTYDHSNPLGPYIRNHHNGWVFCTQNITKPQGIEELAIKAIKTIGLEFGGVDIIWNQYENTCYVLEVNTAPGIDNTTANLYSEEILKCTH